MAENANSILITTKKLLGLPADHTEFDTDVIVNINAALFTLQQLGFGHNGYFIIGDTETWDEFAEYGRVVDAVKQYVYMRVKMAFDPPTNSFVLTAMKEQVQELEWRIKEQLSYGQ